MLDNNQIIVKIQNVLNKIRPYLQNDGGDVEFKKFENGICYVKMLGACQGCGSIDTTLSDLIEAFLLEEVEGVIGVELVSDEE